MTLDELKLIEWKNMTGEQRKEYKKLLEEEKNDAVKEDDQTPDSTEDTDKTEDTEEKTTKDVTHKFGATILTSSVTGVYKFIKNVKFNGQYYKEHATCPELSREERDVLMSKDLISFK